MEEYAQSPEEIFIEKEDLAYLKYSLGVLPNYIKQVIGYKYGLNDKEPHTLKETARYFKQSPEKIRLICLDGIKRLHYLFEIGCNNIHPIIEQGSNEDVILKQKMLSIKHGGRIN